MARLLGIRIKNYRSLADFSLGQTQYARGEPLPRFVCLIGRNGSGKSTLLDAFGFLADALVEGVESACDKSGRGGFAQLRTQGGSGPIEFELFFEDDDSQRPIVYRLDIDEEDGVPVVVRETLRQRRRGKTRGKPYHFLKIANGAGRVWVGEFDETDSDNSSSRVELADRTSLGIVTYGNLADHPRIVRIRQYIERWYLSYFVPDAAREKPPSGAQRWLDRRGSNVGNVLQYFKRTYPEEFASILETVRGAVPGIRRITPIDSPDKRLLLQFEEVGFAEPFFQSSMSDGTLKMLAYAVLLADPQPRPFIGIEEPENGLYVEAIEAIARRFVGYTDAPPSSAGTQILVTTHSPYFVDALRPEHVWQIAKDVNGHAHATRVADMPNVVALADEGVPLGAQWYSGHFAQSESMGPARRAPARAKPAKKAAKPAKKAAKPAKKAAKPVKKAATKQVAKRAKKVAKSAKGRAR